MAIAAASDNHWEARLALKLSGGDARTVITHRKHYGPLVIQKPFYPEGGVCHVYLLHPPGGVVGGDSLTLDVEVEQQGHALMTTPAAGKFYRSDGRIARLSQSIRVAAGSTMEWLPQETILFSASEVDMQTVVQLEANAGFIGWEVLCLGRPASGELYRCGSVRQRFEIWRDNRPLVLDRSRFAGDDEVLHAAWGLQSFTATGTMMAVNASMEMLERVRENSPMMRTGLFSATLIDDVLVCRALGEQAEHVRSAFIHVWKELRSMMLARASCEPRIWFT